MSLFNLNESRARKFHNDGQALFDAGNDSEAIESYLKAIELDPSKSETFYNIGLIYKYQGEWFKSFEYNARAYELEPDDEAARWNLAIAATALRNWPVARRAWTDNGIALEGEAGPIDMNFGITPVRLNPEESAEVVWATRIDPVRAQIDSIPYKESGYKHGDIVLHDGAAVGERTVGEIKYPVFNVLELFESSNCLTAVATVEIGRDNDLDILEGYFAAERHDFEDWTTNIRPICRQCSEGTPHEHHDKELSQEWESERTLGVAVYEKGAVLDIFTRWQKSSDGKLLKFDI